MQYSGSRQSSVSQSSRNAAPLIKGGGLIPPILLEESRVPRFYKDAIASCGAIGESQLPNTTHVYNLMVASGLPRPMLSYIWTIVNRTLPGQLTRQEFYSCLALIALAQKGQTLCALSLVSTLPVPQLQLPASPMSSSQSDYTLQHNTTKNSCYSSEHKSGNASDCQIESTVPRKILFPTSISMQNFGNQQFPSAAENAALCFTRSLDVRSFHRNDNATTSSSPQQKVDITLPDFVNFSRGSEKNIKEAVSTADRMYSKKSQLVTETITEESSHGQKLMQGNNSKVLPAPVPNTALRVGEYQRPAVAAKSLDLLLDLSLPSTSSTLHSCATENSDRLGFATSQKGGQSVRNDNMQLDASSSEFIKNADIVSKGVINANTGELVDIYAAVKMVDNTHGDNCGVLNDEELAEKLTVWRRCIGESLKIFIAGNVLLSSYSKECLEMVARTEKGEHYFLALRNVYEMVKRIAAGRDEILTNERKTLEEINHLWCLFKDYLSLSSDTIYNDLDGSRCSRRCSICITAISDDVLLQFAGNDYHKYCANFWTNRVNSVLPKLA